MTIHLQPSLLIPNFLPFNGTRLLVTNSEALNAQTTPQSTSNCFWEKFIEKLYFFRHYQRSIVKIGVPQN